AMISPARFPNCLKSTGATSPLSLKSADIVRLWPELDHRSFQLVSFSFGLPATGTPTRSPVRLLPNTPGSRLVPELKRPFEVPNHIVSVIGFRARSGPRKVGHRLAREQPHRGLRLGTPDHAEIHLQGGAFEPADAAMIIIDGATNLFRSSD